MKQFMVVLTLLLTIYHQPTHTMSIEEVMKDPIALTITGIFGACVFGCCLGCRILCRRSVAQRLSALAEANLEDAFDQEDFSNYVNDSSHSSSESV